MTRLRWFVCVGVVCRLLGAASAAAAQGLPSEPITIGDGLVTISSDISASLGWTDPGFFNYTDYER